MFNKLKAMFATPAAEAAAVSTVQDMRALRLATMIEELGEPEHVLLDTDNDFPVDVYAFCRNFIEECDEESADDDGYVLVTNGMSDKLMHRRADSDSDESLAVELIWYVREVTDDYVHYLRWLAKLAQIDKIWLGRGHTVPMPDAPLDGCAFKTFFFMSPIFDTDNNLLNEFQNGEHRVDTLTVNLISPAEYALVKTGGGLNQFFDLLDEHSYPPIHDPLRKSYV